MDPARLAIPGVRSLRPYQPGKPIETLQREYGVSSVVKLASNENPLGPSSLAVAAMRGALDDIARYPDGNGHDLKQRLGAHMGVEPECITLGNGSNDILEFAARVFVNSGESVMFSAHAFAVYPLVTQAIGAQAQVIPTRVWSHDLEAMAAAVGDKTRLIFIANPNNPTGTWLDAASLTEFMEAVPDNVIVVVDEAYNEYVTEAQYPHCHTWLGRYPNLIVSRTFSKAYGLAGIRVGYSVSSPQIADLLNRVRQPFNVNSIALAGASAALEDQAHIKRSREHNHQGLLDLAGAFDSLGLQWIDSVANFIAVDMGQPAAPLYEALLRQGVIVRPVANYDMPDFLRVTVGLAEENEIFIKALRTVLET
ncbi:MAG: histidinol-phosphate transaminase [Gammaproteobacteria bacterium]|nr:histidinol-phosphate transaminase [Gammaproteobacteria bacterium]